MRINFSQFSSHSVVFPDKERMDHGQDSLLVNSGVSSQETVDVLAGPDAALVRLVELEGEEGLHALGLEYREHFELTSLEGPQLLLNLVVIGVDGAGVEQGRDLVETVGQGRKVLKATCVKIRVFQPIQKTSKCSFVFKLPSELFTAHYFCLNGLYGVWKKKSQKIWISLCSSKIAKW